MTSTRDSIINAALQEFAKEPYDRASINSICAYGGFSKGIVYHYFDSKETLYLHCATLCFEHLAKHLKSNEIKKDRFENMIKKYYALRMEFFREYPRMQSIFVNVLFHSPKQLFDHIKKAKQPLDQYNYEFFRKVLEHVVMKDSYTYDQVIGYFEFISDGVIHQLSSNRRLSDEEMLIQQEQKINEYIHVILFGITEGVVE